MTYEERLPVPWTWWLIALGLLASLAVAVYAYLDPLVAGAIVGVATGVIVVGLVGYTLRIRIADDTLTVGRYRIEGRYLAGARVDDGELRGVEDGDAHLVLRSYVKQKVRITLADPADPRPSWVVSTRRPEEFAAAVASIAEG